MARKPAITGLARPKGFADDAAKFGVEAAKKLGSQFARSSTKRRGMAKTRRMADKHMEIMRKSGKRWDGK